MTNASGTSAAAPRLACVTGAAGFIGSHVVRELLGAGHHVRATVRDPGDAAKVAHLKALPGARERLELHAADLETDGSFDAIVAGCEWVVHAASTVKLTARDPQREIVDVAVGGTRNVLAAVAGAHTVRRLVVTSSVAAIVDAARPGHTYSEVDWNETSTLRGSPYPLSKTLAEREAWRIVEAIAPDRRPRLVTLQPVLVLGPILARAHARSSPAVLLDLMRGKFPAAPRLSFGVVDVRDVARAHRLALELDAAQGRYLLHHENLWLLDMARHLAARFPHHPLPRRRLPDPLAYAAALFDRRLSFAFLRTHLGRTLALDTSKVERELGLTFRPVDETLADTAVSFLEHGLVAPR